MQHIDCFPIQHFFQRGIGLSPILLCHGFRTFRPDVGTGRKLRVIPIPQGLGVYLGNSAAAYDSAFSLVHSKASSAPGIVRRISSRAPEPFSRQFYRPWRHCGRRVLLQRLQPAEIHQVGFQGKEPSPAAADKVREDFSHLSITFACRDHLTQSFRDILDMDISKIRI